MVFDARRAMLKDPDLFLRFVVSETAVKLTGIPIPGDEQLDDTQRFYPKLGIEKEFEDDWHGRPLHIRMHRCDGIPFAEFLDGHRPLQLFTRWYGFSYTFPACEIYCHDATHGTSEAIERPILTDKRFTFNPSHRDKGPP